MPENLLLIFGSPASLI